MRAKLLNLLDQLPVDNKLLTSFVTVALTRAVLAVGLDVNDPLIATGISLAVGAVIGYLTPNEATDLRQPQPSGNAEVPPNVDPHDGDPFTGGEEAEEVRP